MPTRLSPFEMTKSAGDVLLIRRLEAAAASPVNFEIRATPGPAGDGVNDC